MSDNEQIKAFGDYLRTGRPDEKLTQHSGGYLVSSTHIVWLVQECGIELPDLPEYYEVQAQIDAQPWWWQWLFEKCYINKVANFIVFIFPKMPSVLKWQNKQADVWTRRLDLQYRAALEAWPQILEMQEEQDDC